MFRNIILALSIFIFASAAEAQNTITAVAGGGGLSGGASTSVILPYPGAIAGDHAGNGYAVSLISNVIYKQDKSGNISVFAGNGLVRYGGDGGPALAASLSYPVALTVDASNNVYVADRNSSRIRKIDATTGIITTVVGNGTQGYSGDGGPATQASLNLPAGVAVDHLGNLYVADSLNRIIRRVDATTGVISTIAGIPLRGGYSGDGGLATAAHIGVPASLAFDSSGNLFFVQIAQCTVRRIDAVTGIITQYAGSIACGAGGDGGPATSAFLQFINAGRPPQLAFDASNNLLITDQVNQRIRRVDASTGFISTVAGTGTAGFSGNGGPAILADLNYPSGVSVNKQGEIFISDSFNNVVRKVGATPQHLITTNDGTGSIGDGGPATSGVLSALNGVALDGHGNVLIGDSQFNIIRKVDTSQTLSTIAGTPSLAGSGGDGGPAAQATFSFPGGVVFDAVGNLFIADTSNNRVRRIDASTGFITTVAGNGTAGYTGDGAAATQAGLSGPYGVGFDSSGNLFIADTGNDVIRRVDSTTQIISTVAGNGTAGFNGDNVLATLAQLNFPTNVKVDSHGNLFIADLHNARVRRVDHATAMITTYAGTGSAVWSGNGGPASQAGIGFPWGIGLDSSDNLFLSDDSNQALWRVDAATGTIATIAGNHGCNDTGTGGPATQASICFPADIVIDAVQNLYFGDSGSRRILKINLAPVSSISGSFSDFGLVSLGVTSLPETIVITNTGSTSLVLTNLITTPNFAAIISCANATVAPLQNCPIKAFFSPASTGPHVGTLSFSTNDPAHPSYSFNLSGTGFAGPSISVSPSSLAFGNQIVSTTSPAQTITFSNTGSTNVVITNIAVTGANPGDFTETNNCPLSPATLAPGNSCGIFVTFTPLAIGARSASVVFTDNQGDFVRSQQSVFLSGTGTDVSPIASTTYHIKGNPFTTFQFAAACPPSCNVTGSFSFNAPLAPNLSNAAVIPAYFTFNVGPAVLNQSNATSASFSNISTDANGRLTAWSIRLSTAGFLIVTNNFSDSVGDTYQQNSPLGIASNRNNAASFAQTTITPLTFPASTSPVSQVATLNCPSGTTPCSDANAHSLKITVPAINTGFTLTVTSIEVPLAEANGICEAGQTEATDFDCRFKSTFAIRTLPNGDTIVPQCVPYSNGNCVFYRVSNTPPGTAYSPGVSELTAWNNASFVPPAIYAANNPRLYDDPDAPPFDKNHQFVFDITDYFNSGGGQVGVDPVIKGHTKQFNDFVVAFPAALPDPPYTFKFLAPLSTSAANFDHGSVIPVDFTLAQGSTPITNALTPPNTVGVGVMDAKGFTQPALAPDNSPAAFIYDPAARQYKLSLTTQRYTPGTYTLLVGSNLFTQETATFTIVTPQITGTTSGTGTQSGTYYVDVQFKNTGTDVANSLKLIKVSFRTLTGTGTVTYSVLSPQLPDSLGNLAVGSTTTVRFFLNVPSTVTRFAIMESGTLSDASGHALAFASLQAVTH